MCLASQEHWLQSWHPGKWALQTVKLKSFAENVCQLFLYQMLQETKWENLFHLKLQITAKSLPGLIYTHGKSICLAGWSPWVLAECFAALQPQVLGARCEVLNWNRQLTTSRGAWEAPCSLFPLTLPDSHDLSTDAKMAPERPVCRAGNLSSPSLFPTGMQKHAWCEKCVRGTKPKPKQTKK